MTRRRTAPIHFYDTDEGFVYYTSLVPGFVGFDFRIYDAVREVADLRVANLFQSLAEYLDHVEVVDKATDADWQRLHEESVAVSLAGMRFLDRIMTTSPFRDGKAWKQRRRAAFMHERAYRRRMLLNHMSQIDAPSAGPIKLSRTS